MLTLSTDGAAFQEMFLGCWLTPLVLCLNIYIPKPLLPSGACLKWGGWKQQRVRVEESTRAPLKLMKWSALDDNLHSKSVVVVV